MPSMIWSKITAIAYEDDLFFIRIRCVQQMCQDFNSQDFELILRIVSVVYIAL